MATTVLKQKLKRKLFSATRKAGLLKVLRQTKLVPTVRGYLPANNEKTLQALRQQQPAISIERIERANAQLTKMPMSISGRSHRALRPIRPAIETILLDIQDPRFSYRNNHVLDSQLNVVDEQGYEDGVLKIFRQILEKPQPLSGTVAYLSNAYPFNFYHWMCRILPALALYDERFGLDTIDYFYIGSVPVKGFVKESLVRAGIPADKLIHHACTADRLLAAIPNRASFDGSAPINEAYFRYSRQLFQDVLGTAEQTPQKTRIYVARGNIGRRQVLNEAAVLSCLQAYGFESVSMDGKTLQAQAEIFAQAEAIVAPHGAALTNLLFAPENVTLIELFPDGYVNNCFYTLANYLSADYAYLESQDTEQDALPLHWRDIKVDIPQLKQLCDRIFSNALTLQK